MPKSNDQIAQDRKKLKSHFLGRTTLTVTLSHSFSLQGAYIAGIASRARFQPIWKKPSRLGGLRWTCVQQGVPIDHTHFITSHFASVTGTASRLL